MMNKLIVFGDSFSAPYDITSEHYKKYHDYLDGQPFPKIWPELLAEELNLELACLAIGGGCNYTIFESFCKNVNIINENDIVIIGWSFIERFRIYDEKSQHFRTLVPQFPHDELLKNLSKDAINEFFYNRSFEYWGNEIKNWEILILRLQKLINFKLMIWSFDDRLSKSNINLHYKLGILGAETIIQETNNAVDDRHYGKMGHIVQSKYFYEKIIKMDSSNYIRL